MTEGELEEIVDDLNTCLDLLETAGEAYRVGNDEEMFLNMSTMAPRLERATKTLAGFLRSRREGEGLDVIQMDADLEGYQMEWGNTRTPEDSNFVADGICIALRDACEPEFLNQIDQARQRVDATESGVQSMWEKMIAKPRSVLGWGGIKNERVIFSYNENQNVFVDANRLAALRATTLFERAELSPSHPESVVLCRMDGTPVAAIRVSDD